MQAKPTGRGGPRHLRRGLPHFGAKASLRGYIADFAYVKVKQTDR